MKKLFPNRKAVTTFLSRRGWDYLGDNMFTRPDTDSGQLISRHRDGQWSFSRVCVHSFRFARRQEAA